MSKPTPKYDQQRLEYLYRVLNGITAATTLLFFVSILAIIYISNTESIDESINQITRPKQDIKIYKESVLDNPDLVKNGIHVRTGLVFDKDFKLVRGACTSCHSAKLITQNRATREGWQDMIIWMQRTQGLTDLGKSEPIILDYLTRHYAPKNIGRRKPMNYESIEWYELEL